MGMKQELQLRVVSHRKSRFGEVRICSGHPLNCVLQEIGADFGVALWVLASVVTAVLLVHSPEVPSPRRCYPVYPPKRIPAASRD